jgi:hypothetical protein
MRSHSVTLTTLPATPSQLSKRNGAPPRLGVSGAQAPRRSAAAPRTAVRLDAVARA